MEKFIFKNEEINFQNLLLFLRKYLNRLFLYNFLICLFYSLIFFISTPEYTSKITFYTNYSEDTLSINSTLSSIAGINKDSNLKFSISNYVGSDKFYEDICNAEYLIDGQKISLTDKWGSNYNNYFRNLNPLSILLKINKNFMVNDFADESEIKLFFAKDYLKSKLTFKEDRRSDLKTLTLTLPKNASLSKEILLQAYESINNYSYEISSSKARDKTIFLEDRLQKAKNDLIISEEKYVSFLEKNKSLNSPNLIVSKDRLKRDIELYGQIVYQLSSQLELEKVKEKDFTSSIFLLDTPKIAPLKTGTSILKGCFYLVIIFSTVFYSFNFYVNRKNLIST